MCDYSYYSQKEMILHMNDDFYRTPLKKILELNPHVVCAYLYGSPANSDTYYDIDSACWQNPYIRADFMECYF